MARKVHGRDQHDGVLDGVVKGGEEQGGGMGPRHDVVGDDVVLGGGKALDDMGLGDEVKGDGQLKNRLLYILARPDLSTYLFRLPLNHHNTVNIPFSSIGILLYKPLD